MYGKVSRRESESYTWLHPASLPMRTIILYCFAAGIDVALLENDEKRRAKQEERFGVELVLKYRPR